MRMWFRFVKAIFKGEWKISPLSWIAAIGTVIYVVSPIDFVPEAFLPLIGYVDDLGLMGDMALLATREKSHWTTSLRDGAIHI